jgi:hypothetical protein
MKMATLNRFWEWYTNEIPSFLVLEKLFKIGLSYSSLLFFKKKLEMEKNVLSK